MMTKHVCYHTFDHNVFIRNRDMRKAGKFGAINMASFLVKLVTSTVTKVYVHTPSIKRASQSMLTD